MAALVRLGARKSGAVRELLFKWGFFRLVQDHVCVQASFKLVIKFLAILKVTFSCFILD